jgi:EAL domain-containing protein (putative c-di-GMP-specific phosphodiesterase class I)
MFGWGRSKKPVPPAAEAATGKLFEPLALLSALDKLLPRYLKETDEGRLVYPACKRGLGDTDGNVRAIWEHTRLEACRYFMMVPRRDVELLVYPARQNEMIETFLREAPHQETVVNFEGVPLKDYPLAIMAGLNWLDHSALLAGVAPDKFRRTQREFRRLVALGARWWAIEGAGARCNQMLANRETPPLMFYLVWQTYTRLAKEIAIASIYGSSLDRAIERDREQVVISALANSGLPPKRLELEITESVFLAETEANLAILHQLRELGVSIAMDDFGTGYSSLSYLRSFPFDKIKIDRSFVKDLAKRSDCAAIVRAISGLGRSLNITTTAEGVETTEQLDWLRAEGCNEVQGFLFSGAKPAAEVEQLLRRFGVRASRAA